MSDDEPLDDARAMAVAAAAAVAKVAETAARAAADHCERQQRPPAPEQSPRELGKTEAADRQTRLDQATTWVQTHDPKTFDAYICGRINPGTTDERRSAELTPVRTLGERYAALRRCCAPHRCQQRHEGGRRGR